MSKSVEHPAIRKEGGFVGIRTKIEVLKEKAYLLPIATGFRCPPPVSAKAKYNFCLLRLSVCSGLPQHGQTRER